MVSKENNSHSARPFSCSANDKFSVVGSASLQILNVSLSDDGVYTCRGDNWGQVSDAAARLSVKGKYGVCVLIA